jgi:indole-3-glycerol phosphate synthase
VGFLTEMVERVRKDLERRPLDEGTLLLRTKALPHAADFEGALRRPGMSLVAEMVRASPSAGAIAERDAAEQAARYELGGASAISVLTEPRFFDGSLVDLRSIRRRTTLPVLRRDFIVHPAQVIEARAEGADAVLLIAAALSALQLEDLRGTAGELGMGVLVEVHSEKDLELALASGANVIGVAARDPESLEIDAAAAFRLAREVPRDHVLVIEDGIDSRHHVVEAEEAGAHAVLVGEVLMRAQHPEVTIRRLLGMLRVAGEDDGS